MNSKIKLVRITTIPLSLKVLLKDQLRFMSGHFHLLAIASPGPLLNEVAVQEGVATKAVSMSRAITPVQDLKALWKLYKLLKKEKPFIVHTHTPKAGLLGMMAAKMAGVPLRLHTVAGLPLMEASGAKRKLLEKVEWLTYSCATKVYPNSTNLARFILKSRFCTKDKIKVLGNGSSNGIDTDFFAPNPDLNARSQVLKQELGVTEKNFVFLFIGRLVKDKGIEELVAAFIDLKKKIKDTKLLLVGPFEPDLDPVSSQTEQYIKEDKDIICVGFQNDVRPYLAISNALAFPSYREGFPNVPMQAGCFHLPSIVTDINGCNEIIVHEKNGLIVPAKSKEALQQAMEIMATNRDLYLRMQENARPMIVNRYDQKYFWNLLLEEYKEQLKNHAVVS